VNLLPTGGRMREYHQTFADADFTAAPAGERIPRRAPDLSTFAFISCAEKFILYEQTGLLRPQVTTLKASDGNLEFFAVLSHGRYQASS
jgi:hypothetical protein